MSPGPTEESTKSRRLLQGVSPTSTQAGPATLGGALLGFRCLPESQTVV